MNPVFDDDSSHDEFGNHSHNSDLNAHEHFQHHDPGFQNHSMPDAPHSDLFHSEWDMNHPEDPNPPDPLERVPAHPDPPGNFHQSWTPDI